jgi:uncharacterized membrane protein YkvI
MDGVLQTMDWQKQQLHDFRWMISPFTYTALNFAFVQAVMVSLGSEVEDENALKWGGFWGGVGLGFMLLISHFAINSRIPDILRFDILMAEIIRNLGRYFHIMFLLVIYGEIFTTLIGNVFGITRQIRSLYALPKSWVVLATLLTCFLISQVGFTFLLAYLYPLFGHMGMIFLDCGSFSEIDIMHRVSVYVSGSHFIVTLHVKSSMSWFSAQL